MIVFNFRSGESGESVSPKPITVQFKRYGGQIRISSLLYFGVGVANLSSKSSNKAGDSSSSVRIDLKYRAPCDLNQLSRLESSEVEQSRWADEVKHELQHFYNSSFPPTLPKIMRMLRRVHGSL
ncbi:predicted protein [Sclerotinia sclerotiorum 1980 UF-70]|uniref:Uncharacterized protein n=1 Tax=Sclerotinia sclerotiorum (strain ATCC 18683 / 1980 / Ss-1) TaxID=665079 RepID=A7EVH8_SCLS1|nr:predicted protein [Sclerotinia sclerotiorum 1980 UF-70]EDN93470.1 predicted protein [Sclerotinia sclerotiorum 1980 UF-70]